MAEPRTDDHADKTAAASDGAPRQALSGGGSNVQAGSDQGGSRSGAEPEHLRPPQAPEPGRGQPMEPASAQGDGAAAADGSEAVNNTGEPDQMTRRKAIEQEPGDDVDAPSG